MAGRYAADVIDLLVVGAGPTGLTAAWRAARRGLSVRVIERSTRVGGLTASDTIAGQRVDLGSHRLHPATAPHLLEALRDLLGDDLQRRARHGRLRVADRWLAFPLRGGDVVRNLPPRFARDAALAKLRHAAPEAERSYASVVRARFGATMLDEIYGPFARKLWGVDPASLHEEVARHRISVTGATDLVRRTFAPAASARREFFYPRNGFGQITDALADAATHAGATIDLGAGVRSMRVGPGSVDVVLDHDHEHDHVAAGRVLWTAPAAALSAVLDTTPTSVRDDLARQRTRGVVLVYLVVDAPHYTEFDAHYLPNPAIAMTRVSEPKNYRDGPDPATRTVLCAELPCWPHDSVWRDAEQRGPALVLEGLARAALPAPRVCETRVRRCPSVYPVLERATAPARARIDAWASTPGRVTVLGRQGLGVADNLHHVMAMGWDAGELAARGWDDDTWGACRARYRDNVVQD